MTSLIRTVAESVTHFMMQPRKLLSIIAYLLLSMFPSGTVCAQDTWSKLYGGSAADAGYSIVVMPDGGAILAGITRSMGGELNLTVKGAGDAFVARLAKNGTVVWGRSIGGSGDDTVTSVTLTLDGGIMLTGHTNSRDGDFASTTRGQTDVFVINLDGAGNVIRRRTYTGARQDKAYSIITMSDGWIITGATQSFDGDFNANTKPNGWEDVYCTRISVNADIFWTRTFGNLQFPDEGFASVATEEDGVFITGYTSYLDTTFTKLRFTEEDMIAVLLDAEGRPIWRKIIGGKYSDEGAAATRTSDGGYAIAGHTFSHETIDSLRSRGEEDVLVAKLSGSGDVLWKRVLGGTKSERARAIAGTRDGGVLVSGYTRSGDLDFSQRSRTDQDVFLARYSTDGVLMWLKYFGGTGTDDSRSIATYADDGCILTGTTASNDYDFRGMNKGMNDVFVIKLDANGNYTSTSVDNDPLVASPMLRVAPNPTQSYSTISATIARDGVVRIELVNVLGEVVDVVPDQHHIPGTMVIPFESTQIAPGPYIVRMVNDGMITSSTFVVTR